MSSLAKTAAYGLFSALLLALTVPSEPDSCALPTGSAAPVLSAPSLSVGTRVSTAGYYTLAWEPPEAPVLTISGFEVRARAEDGGGKVHCTGLDHARRVRDRPASGGHA